MLQPHRSHLHSVQCQTEGHVLLLERLGGSAIHSRCYSLNATRESGSRSLYWHYEVIQLHRRLVHSIKCLLLGRKPPLWQLIEHGFTSAPTQYRLYGRRFLQVWWPNQQCQSTEGAAQMSVQLQKARKLLESSYGNIPSCSWPNHSSDVVKWSSRGDKDNQNVGHAKRQKELYCEAATDIILSFQTTDAATISWFRPAHHHDWTSKEPGYKMVQKPPHCLLPCYVITLWLPFSLVNLAFTKQSVRWSKCETR